MQVHTVENHQNVNQKITIVVHMQNAWGRKLLIFRHIIELEVYREMSQFRQDESFFGLLI